MPRWPGMLTDGGLGRYYQLTEREETGLDQWHKLLHQKNRAAAYDLEQ